MNWKNILAGLNVMQLSHDWLDCISTTFSQPVAKLLTKKIIGLTKKKQEKKTLVP